LTFYKAQLGYLKTFLDQWKALPKDRDQGYQIKETGFHTFHLGCIYIQEQDETPLGFLNPAY
jgi:hypothetical protein